MLYYHTPWTWLSFNQSETYSTLDTTSKPAIDQPDRYYRAGHGVAPT